MRIDTGMPLGLGGLTASSRTDIAALTARLEGASPHDIVVAGARLLPGRLAVVSSFGIESAVLLKFVADIDPSLPVLLLDTQWLFKETLAYRDALIERLKLSDVRTLSPSPSAVALDDPKRDLCFRDRDACCAMRKVIPLAVALADFDGWISGRKRMHGGERGALPVVEADGPRLKFNPLARLTRAEMNSVFAGARLPRHPLETLGFTSVGCVPCTGRPTAGTGGRDGRWGGLAKTECGIHSGPLPSRRG
jgi:phosphoadenosine phosphosulfate reductase